MAQQQKIGFILSAIGATMVFAWSTQESEESRRLKYSNSPKGMCERIIADQDNYAHSGYPFKDKQECLDWFNDLKNQNAVK